MMHLRSLTISLLFVPQIWAAQLYYSSISINSGQVPSTQTDFPVLVSQTDNRFKSVSNGGHVASSSGFDIRPYTDTTLGTAITGYELERYNASTGEVVMWVKVSSLASSTTPIVLGYGDTSLTTDGSSGTTWSNSFKFVYHLKDGTTLSTAESVTGGFNMSNSSTPPTATSGKIDGAASFVSSSTEYMENGNTTTQPTEITVSAWVNATSFPNAYNTIAGFNRNTPTIQAMMWVKSTGKMTFFVQGTGSVGYDGTGSHTLSSSTDYYICLTYSSSAGLGGYVNASSDGTASANGALATSAGPTWSIANDHVTSGRNWNGKIDEVRFATVVRSADWITTEYNNQSAPGTFETLGDEVSLIPGAQLGGWFFFIP